MKLNNKGFTLIELLAAVTILSVLTVLSFAAFTRYGAWTKKKAYDTMARSASTAAEQYVMDFPAAVVPEDEATTHESYEKGIKLKTLVDRGYLNNVNDPNNKGHDCSGKVVIGYSDADKEFNSRALDRYTYIVYICCYTYQARYTYKVDYEETIDETKPATSDERYSKVLKQKDEVTTDKELVICE